MDMMTLFLFTLMPVFFFIMILIGYIMITAPIAVPYLKTKLRKGVLLIIKNDTGRYVLTPVGMDYHTKKYGSFIPNPDAIIPMAGIPVAFASAKNAIIPTKKSLLAALKLKRAKADIYKDINDTAKAAQEKGIIEQVDVDSIYDYSLNISPNFIEKRIAIRVNEILATNRDTTAKMFTYVIMFIMVLIGGALAYYIVTSGSGSAVAESLTSTVNNVQPIKI